MPTYLIDYPVATNPDSAAIVAGLAAGASCEVGAQLHPWVTPPHDEIVNDHNSFAGNLPDDLEDAKIAAITGAVTRLLGRPPITYRAGRYGVGAATASALRRHGYRLDTSIRALYDYRAHGGPDFTRHPATPWWVADDLLEVPLTAAWIGPLRGMSVGTSAAIPKLLSHTRLRTRVALTPEDMPVDAVLRAIDQLDASDYRLFNLSFHTPSLVPGHTPYVRDAADLCAFWRWWDSVLNRFAALGITPVSASEIVAAADAARLASAPAEPLFAAAGPVAQG